MDADRLGGKPDSVENLSALRNRAKFSQPFRLEKDLFEQWNANQNILPLMAEGHIQFSQGQRPWYKVHTKIVRSANVVTDETAVSNEIGMNISW